MRQRWRDSRQVHYHKCKRVMHGSRRKKKSNNRWWACRHNVRTLTQGLAIDHSWGTKRTATILIIQRWDHNHRWHCNERQNNNNTCTTVRQNTKITAPRPHGQREDKAAYTWAHLLNQHECWQRRNSPKVVHFPWFPNNMTKDKTILHKIWRPLESVGADRFTINSKNYLCIVDYHSSFLVVKQVEGSSADNLTKHARLSFQTMDCPVKQFQTLVKTLFQRKRKFLQVTQHMSPGIIIIYSSMQWTSRNIYKICQKNHIYIYVTGTKMGLEKEMMRFRSFSMKQLNSYLA